MYTSPKRVKSNYMSNDKAHILIVMAVAAMFGIGLNEKERQTYAGVASVIDGDTLDIHGQRFRLFGIDAPESAQTCQRDGKAYLCGKEAAMALADLIGQQTVACTQEDVDRYKRIVATCRVGETDLNGWMVAHGHALAYRHYSSRYVEEERRAKEARAGIWAGTFQEPWYFRHKKKPGVAAEPF